MARVGTKGIVMSDERKIQFEFNTAITGLEPETGKWDENVHKDRVMPLRGLIMQIDGVSGCFIGRYGMRVDYMPNVVSKTRVAQQVKAAVKVIASIEGFFPIKDKKTPSVRPEKRAVSVANDTWWVARVDFNTDLYADKSEEFMKAVKDQLNPILVNADGARETGIWQRGLYVKFDKRVTTSESMEAHLKKVVAKIMKKRIKKGFFPFADPTFSYRAYRTNYVI